jgi:hypothetical protein
MSDRELAQQGLIKGPSQEKLHRQKKKKTNHRHGAKCSNACLPLPPIPADPSDLAQPQTKVKSQE